MRYTYHWVEGCYQYKKTVRSHHGKILFKVQKRNWMEDEHFHDFMAWKYDRAREFWYGKTAWAIADKIDLDLGIWGV